MTNRLCIMNLAYSEKSLKPYLNIINILFIEHEPELYELRPVKSS